jgi:hypothetical protein
MLIAFLGGPGAEDKKTPQTQQTGGKGQKTLKKLQAS